MKMNPHPLETILEALAMMGHCELEISWASFMPHPKGIS
tara:strand:+ start:22004 stop:22120 length:117 start_codon:yes stop_codon:yes gene_type:complete